MRYQSTAAEQNKALQTGAGTLRSIAITNVNTVTRYLWVFDGLNAAGAPASLIDGPTPIGPGERIAIDFTPDGLLGFTTGLYVASSSTSGTFTASGSNDFMFHVEYSDRGF